MQDEVAITRVFERFACWFVEGVVKTSRGWQKAAFTVSKPDVTHMTRQEFEAFAKRNLPHVIEGTRFEGAPV